MHARKLAELAAYLLAIGGCGNPAVPGAAPTGTSPQRTPERSASAESPTSEDAAIAPEDRSILESFPKKDPTILERSGARYATLTLDGFPPQRFLLVRARLLRSGTFRVGSSYVRTRPGGERATVTLRVWIDAHPTNTPRIVYKPGTHPSELTQLTVGDFVEIPVPLADPWGTRSDFTWREPESDALSPAAAPGSDCSAAHTGELRSFDGLAPVLSRAEARCVRRVLANLREVEHISYMLTASAPGRLTSPPVHVLREGEELVVFPSKLLHIEERPGGGSSAGTLAIAEAPAALRIGDRLVVDRAP